jgi:CheY-like chemotaxis protein
MEAVGLLTAGIAHDFNNIILAIGGSAELIASRSGCSSAQASPVSTILRAVERASTLTGQLLAVGRKQSLKPHNADINVVLRGMEELLITTLGGLGRIVLQLSSTPATSFVDTSQLEQTVLNLVINARDAMPNGGSVTIKTANIDAHSSNAALAGLVGGHVLISVSDTGIGMPETVCSRAFDPFFTTKKVGSGSGLGLSQVYGFVNQSGGDTRIDSRVGEGTTVSIYLPRITDSTFLGESANKPRLVNTPRAPDLGSKHGGRRVLVLDDDNQVLEVVAEILSGAGYSVAPFEVPSEALDEVYGPEPIDLMVVDFAMPEMRGDQFAIEARSRRSAVPILFITGYSDPAALQSEPHVLRKPFSIDQLISRAEEAMRLAA